MYHSITIGGKNTWDDWRLVPASRPVFNPPAQKVKTLEIPGGDGVIDLSQSLTGYPVYQNRTGSIEFIVMNDFKPWHMAYSDIMDYLHGQKLRAVLEDDPEYFYEGRFTVNVWKSEKDWSRITIDYDVGPTSGQSCPPRTTGCGTPSTFKMASSAPPCSRTSR